MQGRISPFSHIASLDNFIDAEQSALQHPINPLCVLSNIRLTLKNKIVTLVSKDGCSLCDAARNVIVAVRRSVPVDFREIVIDEQHAWFAKYGDKLPVVLVNNKEIAYWRISASQLLDSLNDGLQ